VIRVNEVTRQGEHWLVTLRVDDGVYRLASYPVRVERVPRAPDDMTEDEVKTRIGMFVLGRVEHHMRNGSLPPRGTRLDAQDLAFER
jgi:hypothetical protein